MNYARVSNVSPVVSKSGFATSNFALQVTLTTKSFVNIQNVLICRGYSIYIVVEAR